MSYTFFKAMGYEIGKSILDEESIRPGGRTDEESRGLQVCKLLLPVDTVCAREFSNDSEKAVFDRDSIPEDMMGMDIGPKTS